MVLTTAHREKLLDESGLSPATLLASGARSVTADEALALIGTPSAGIAFPYYDLRGELIGHRVKLDASLPDGGKYLQKKGASLHLYFMREDLPRLLDPSLPLYLTEGEKKALALSQVVSDGVVAAIPGCFGWSSGHALAAICGALPLNERRVILLPDSDFLTNPRVWEGYTGLLSAWCALGAALDLVDLSLADASQKVGIDDFLLAGESLTPRLAAPLWQFRPHRADSLPRVIDERTHERILRESVLGTNARVDLLLGEISRASRVSKSIVKAEFLQQQKAWALLKPVAKVGENSLIWDKTGTSIQVLLRDLGAIISRKAGFYSDHDAQQLMYSETKTRRFKNGLDFSTWLADKIDFQMGKRSKSGALVCEHAALPETVAASFLEEYPHYTTLNPLRYHALAPTLIGDEVIYQPGYYPELAVLYSGPEVTPRFELTLTREALAYPYLDEVSRVNALGALLGAVFCRGDFPGAHPMILIQGDHVDLGKSQLAETFGLLATGQTPGSATFKSDDAALEKELATHCLSHDFLCFDNIKSRDAISSPTLERSLTDRVLNFRLLGKNTLIKRRNDLQVICTINEGVFAKDILTRSVVIFLSLAKQSSHTSVKWVAEQQRLAILGELLGMVLTWQKKGCPREKVDFPKFPAWAALINGILRANGIRGFLANHGESAAKLDGISAALVDVGRDELDTLGEKKTPAYSPQLLREKIEASGGRGLFMEIPSLRGKNTKVGIYLRRMVGKSFKYTEEGEPRALTVYSQDNRRRGSKALDYGFEIVEGTPPAEGGEETRDLRDLPIPPKEGRCREKNELNKEDKDHCVTFVTSYVHMYEKENKKNNFHKGSTKEVEVTQTVISLSPDASWLEPQAGEYCYEFRGVNYPSQWWAGEQLANPVCIDLETAVGNHHNIILMSAFDGACVYRVRPAQLAAFVDLHKNHHIICHSSWFDIGNLTASLGRLEVYQALVGENRLQDTLALSMLVSLAEGDPYGNDLGTVTEKYLGVILPKDVEWKAKRKVSLSYGEFPDITTAPAAFLHYNAYDVLAPYFLWDKIKARAEALCLAQGVAPEKLLSYPLLVATGMCGVITSHHGMCLDQQGIEAKARELELAIIASLGVLRGYGYDPVAVRNKKKKAGEPGIQDIFGGILQGLEKTHGVSFAKKYHEGRKKTVYSQSKDDLKAFTSIEFIQEFLRYTHLNDVLATFIAPLRGKARIGSTYRPGKTTGRISSTAPNLQNIPREGGIRELFIAGPGKKLVIADYSGAELHAAGQYCLDHYGASKLAEMLNAGVDVHRFIASKYLKVPEAEVTTKFRQAGKVLNFGRLGGSGAATLQAVAKNTYGVELSLEEVKELIATWDQTFPEARAHFNAANEAQRQALGVDRKEDIYTISKVAQGDSDHLSAHKVRGAWEHMATLLPRYGKLAKFRDQILNQVPSPLLARAIDCLRVSVMEKSGRIRGGCSYTEWCNNGALQGGQADITNTAWGRLLDAGLQVVNVIHDEFIVECDEADAEAVQKKVEEIMLAAAREFNPDMKKMAVESAITDCWKKV